MIVITRALPPQSGARAEALFALRWWDGGEAGREEAFAGAAGLLCTPADRVDAALIAALPASLRVLGTFSVGLDHIDLAAAAARGLPVVYTPDVLSDATAEFTMLLLLAAARRAGEGERMLRAGQWRGFAAGFLLGTGVSGKRLGIFGMGRIGRRLARMAQGFGMQVHYHNRRPAPEAAGCIYHAAEGDFLAACDFLAITAPATPATRHWLNPSRLAQLRPGAIVVNTARGSLVDDAALIAALRAGHIAAAGLDVFPHEPAVPEGYLALEQVVLTPHLGSATRETREAMGHLVLDGIQTVLEGKRPDNLVPAP